MITFLTCRNFQRYNHVIWWDNFSKLYASSIPDVNTGAWAAVLWSGVAIHLYEGPPVDLDLAYDRHGVLQPIMPIDIDDMNALMADELEDLDAEGEFYLAHSLVEQLNVDTVPLKVVVDEDEYPEEYERLDRGHDTLRCFAPVDVLTHNIGSNEGLLIMFRDHCEKHGIIGSGTCSKYTIITADVNIYWRLLKVCSF